jgi:hypothetical protein
MQCMEALVKKGLALMRRYLCWLLDHKVSYFTDDNKYYGFCVHCYKAWHVEK